MAVFAGSERLGITPSETAEWVELQPQRSAQEVEVVIQAIYRQVLGNAYIMESERLEVAESQLKQGDLSVREFVRQLAKSEFYRSRFVEGCNRYRTIELNFKHLLGRAPTDYSEMQAHSSTWDEGGYEADVDSFIDSAEYQASFGETIVPYHRGFQTQVGQKNVGFSRLFQLYRGYANSDRAQKQGQGRLTREVISNLASPIYPSAASALVGTSLGNRGDLYRIRVTQAASANSTVVRRSTAEYLVSYEQLSSKLQQLNRQGRKVLSLTQA